MVHDGPVDVVMHASYRCQRQSVVTWCVSQQGNGFLVLPSPSWSMSNVRVYAHSTFMGSSLGDHRCGVSIMCVNVNGLLAISM